MSSSSEPTYPSSRSFGAAEWTSPARWVVVIQGLLHAPLYPWALRIVLILLAFGNNIDIDANGGSAVPTSDPVGLSLQSLLKLCVIGISGVIGAWGWFVSAQVRLLSRSIPGLVLMCLGGWFILSSIFSPVVSIPMGIAASFSYFAVLLVVLSATIFLSEREVLFYLVLGIFLYVLGGMGLYWIDPAKATFVERMDLTNRVARFGGLGHPNSLGRMAMVSIVLGIGAYLDKKSNWKLLLVLIPIMSLALVASLSRTPIIAGSVAIVAMLGPILSRRSLLYFSGICAGIGVVVLMSLELTIGSASIVDKVIAKGTKTGNVEEVTTLTGRTEIWAYAWNLAMERPILGQGVGATPLLMKKLSGNAHNVLLDSAANTGFPAAGAVAFVFGWCLYGCFRYSSAILRGGTVFLIMVGITERLLFSMIPDVFTYIWVSLALLPLFEASKPPSHGATSLVRPG